LSPADARSVLVQVRSIPVGKPSAKVEDTAFPVGPTGSVLVRIVRPAGTVDVLPAVIYIHGGGGFWATDRASLCRYALRH
jgi:acetyl esterase